MLDEQSCRLCARGAGCPFVGLGMEKLWQEISTRLHRLGLSTDPVWNATEERHILNAIWHYRQREPAEQAELKME